MTFCLTTPLRRASADDLQCQAVQTDGKPCPFAAEEDSNYCRRHQHKQRHSYAVTAVIPKVPRSALFDLTAEVELLKRLIAARAELLKDADSVVIYSGHIADLITRLQKLMDGAIKLEQAKGNLLSRSAAMALIGNIMNAVADVVTDIEQLDKIHQRIEALLTAQEQNQKQD